MRIVLLAIIIILGLLSSCTESNKVKIYRDGELIEVFEIDEDSLRHGVTQKFYSKNKLYETSNYVHGKLNGERLIYYEDGGVEIRERYCMDMFCDTLTTYYPNGNKKFQGVYNHGIMNGIVRVFYETGELKEEVHFINNEEQGPFKEFHKNGNVMWEGTYLNGPNEFGQLTEYDESGTKIKVMECDTLAICRTVWSL